MMAFLNYNYKTQYSFHTKQPLSHRNPSLMISRLEHIQFQAAIITIGEGRVGEEFGLRSREGEDDEGRGLS